MTRLSDSDIVRLESFIINKMRKSKIPGLSIALVGKDGEVLYSRGFGFRDIRSGLPSTPNTIYGIGSVTKSFTALAVMMLAEAGAVRLDDPIEKYVELKLRPKGGTITIHNLLTHTTGLPALAYAEAFIRGVLGLDKVWLPLASPEDIISFMRDSEDWAVSKPGERFFYLNEGYVILGEIISKVSGMKYVDFIREKVLKPLGMSRTYFSKEEIDKDPEVATPYIIDREGKHVPSSFPFGVTSDGGLLSNVADMARYVAMYLGRGRFGNIELVSRKSIELMERPYIKLPYELLGSESYGYGLAIYPNFLGRKLVGHSGSVLVYTAYMGYLPDDGVGVTVLANASGYPLSNLGMYALALAVGQDPLNLPFIYRDEVLSKLEGTYETYKSTYRVEIKRAGDFLLITYRDKYIEYSVPLVPVELKDDYVKFYTLSNGARMDVEFFVEGDRIVLIYERYKMIKKLG